MVAYGSIFVNSHYIGMLAVEIYLYEFQQMVSQFVSAVFYR